MFTLAPNEIFREQVFGIGQGIVVSLAVESGYGKHLKDVSGANLVQVMKVSGFSSLCSWIQC